MATDTKHDELRDSFVDFAHENPDKALSLVTGLFIGLIELTITNGGGDPSEQVQINGGNNRDITLHAVK